VVDSCSEGKFWWFKGVICGEVDVEEEDPAFKGGVGRTKDCGLPVERVIAYRPGAALAGRVITDVLQFFVDSFQGHDLQISNQ